MVRKGGFEPPQGRPRQPLKLVRLPVPPLPRIDARLEGYWGVSDDSSAGSVSAGAASSIGAGPSTPLRSDPGPR